VPSLLLLFCLCLLSTTLTAPGHPAPYRYPLPYPCSYPSLHSSMPPPLLVLRYVVTQSLMPSPFSPHPTLTHSGRVRKGEDNVGLTPPCHDFAGHSVAHRTHDRCPAAPPLFYCPPPPHTHTERKRKDNVLSRTLPATALNPPPSVSPHPSPLIAHTA
jgi:hypothetical protein